MRSKIFSIQSKWSSCVVKRNQTVVAGIAENFNVPETSRGQIKLIYNIVPIWLLLSKTNLFINSHLAWIKIRTFEILFFFLHVYAIIEYESTHSRQASDQ